MKWKQIGGVAVGLLAALLVLTSNASAVTWDFSGTGGNLGNAPVVFTSGSATISVTAWTISSGSFTVQKLFQRSEAPDDLGLGVCNNFDDGGDACKNTPTGNGENNEIDNNGGKQDVIRLDFGVASTGLSVGLSSLDGTSGDIDNFQIFGSALVNPTLAPSGTVFLLASGSESSQSSVNPDFALAGSYRYLYITTSTGSGDDDFLLRSATRAVPIPPSSVPEPASLALLAAGLTSLAGAGVWKKNRRQR